jgi:hypothetical protein
MSSAVGYAMVKEIFNGYNPKEEMIIIFFTSCLALFVAFSTKQIFTIDLTQKIIFDHLWIVGIKIGKRYSLNSVQKIFFNRNKYVKRTYTASRMPFWIFGKDRPQFIYDSYLKFDSGEKIKFISRTDKDQLISELTTVNQIINTEVYDNTSGEAVLVC